ncbi:unnamed protein product [Psylliodes chrysocephalus]|uniref:DNA-directed DNA polymerase n=1 Tax=Psylliodes chrysocephalus TaxID=3402493 RepID=A0A9P0GDE1_9CUCU|nr:unnamed protein product [Psylliodes chrysocephala]
MGLNKKAELQSRVTLPGFTWDAMLKHTSQELEILTDVDMFLRGIRGGLSQVCSKRRAHANNKYIPNYDSSKPSKYLMYLDVNNQYGWAMSQYLPYGGFEWSDTNIDITQIPDDAPEGYMLEVDLEYPEHLHDLHKDLRFCAQHTNPKTGKPRRTAKELTKLMATLQPKTKYVNVENDYNACFAWAVTAALHPTSYGSHPNRVSSYPHYSSVLKLKGIQFPMTLNQIPNFQKQNNISINVYILRLCRNRYVTVPLRLAKEKSTRHVNPLMILQSIL